MNALPKIRSNFEQEYQQKLCSPQEAASIVQSGNFLCFPLNAGEPTLFVEGAGRSQAQAGRGRGEPAAPCLPGLLHRGRGAAHPGAVVVHEPGVPGRGPEGWADFVPNNFGEVPKLLREYWPIDVVATVASPMDEHGFFTCSLSVGYTMEAIRKAGKVVVEVNPRAPDARQLPHPHLRGRPRHRIRRADRGARSAPPSPRSRKRSAGTWRSRSRTARRSSSGSAASRTRSRRRCSARRTWGSTPSCSRRAWPT